MVIQEDLFGNSKEIKTTPHPKPQIETQESPVKIGNKQFYLSIGAEERLPSDPFYDVVKKKDGHYRSVINLKHPFFERFSSLAENQKDYDPIASIIRAMIITEIKMSEDNVNNSFAFRMRFNEIFGSL